MATVSINGHLVTPESQSEGSSQFSPDAAKSNYIILCCSGPLQPGQIQQLRDLQVQILRSIGDYTYRCRYEPRALDQVRSLTFVEYANVYHEDLVVAPALKKQLASSSPTPSQDSSSTSKPADFYHVTLHERERTSETADEIAKLLLHDPATDRIILEGPGILLLPIKREDIPKVARVDNVAQISELEKFVPHNHEARRVLRCHDRASAPQAPPMGHLTAMQYQGAGQIVMVADSGLDLGDKNNLHHAFQDRVIDIVAYSQAATDYKMDQDGHGTFVAGSVLGSGWSSQFGSIQGTAPAAKLVMQNVQSVDGTTFTTQPIDPRTNYPKPYSDLYAQGVNTYGARIHLGSYGPDWPENGIPQGYNPTAQAVDQVVDQYQDYVIVFSAGNTGSERANLAQGTIQTTACAKNIITVGACENRQKVRYIPIQPTANRGRDRYAKYDPNGTLANPDNIAWSSARGPTPEGRQKPDIVAPGTAVYSARSRYRTLSGKITDSLFPWITYETSSGTSTDSNWMFGSGTSVAAPLVAGMCAVIRNAYCCVEDCYPSAAMVKALLINGAYDVTAHGVSAELGPPPNGLVGFGRADLEGALLPLTDPDNGGCHDSQRFSAVNNVRTFEEPLMPGKRWRTIVNVVSVPAKLTATMAYVDIPDAALQNKVSLRLEKIPAPAPAPTPPPRLGSRYNQWAEPHPNNPSLPWNKNNVQRLVINLNDPLDVGQYYVGAYFVEAFNAATAPDSGAEQHFSLCWYVDYNPGAPKPLPPTQGEYVPPNCAVQ